MDKNICQICSKYAQKYFDINCYELRSDIISDYNKNNTNKNKICQICHQKNVHYSISNYSNEISSENNLEKCPNDTEKNVQNQKMSKIKTKF